MALSTEPMSIDLLRKAYKIEKTCLVYPNDIAQSTPTSLIDFWCGGSLVHRFEDKNGDSFWDSHSSYQKFGSLINIDKNFDQKIDFKQSVLIDGENAIVTEFIDSDQKGNFKQIAAYTKPLWHDQVKTCQPLYTYTFFDSSINNLVNTLKACTDPKWNLWVDNSCGSFMKSVIDESLEKGMACLKRGQSSPKIRRILGKIQSIILYQDPAINVSCKDNLGNKIAKARYPLGLNITDPYPSMLISKAHYKSANNYPKDKGVIFHEYLHLALRESHYHKENNVNKIDDVIMCQTCCFGSKDNSNYLLKIRTPWVVKQACKFCTGTDTNINNYRAFMSIWGGDSSMRKLFKRNLNKSRMTSNQLKRSINALSN